MITYSRYIPLALCDEAVRLGWLPHPGLIDTHHGQYAVLMDWMCDCPIRYPGDLK